MTETASVALWLTWYPKEVTLSELARAYPNADLKKALRIVSEYKELRRSNRLD